MSGPLRATVMGSGLVVLAGGWWAYNSLYLSPVNSAEAGLVSLTSEIDGWRDERNSFNDRALMLDLYSESVIATDRESARSEMRRVLNEIAAINGLSRVRTSSDDGRGAVNPASEDGVREFRYGPRNRAIEEVSFVPVVGTLSGVASFERVLNLVAMLESQTFPKRFTKFGISPEDGAGNVEISLELETLVMPGATASPEGPYVVVAATAEATETARRILERQPFIAPAPPPPPPPPPPVVSPPPPPASPSPPPPPPYERWVITAITETEDGPRAWLRNTRNGQTRQLGEGESLFALRFEEIEGLTALVRVGEKRFRLVVGDALNRRDRPVSEGDPPR